MSWCHSQPNQECHNLQVPYWINQTFKLPFSYVKCCHLYVLAYKGIQDTRAQNKAYVVLL